MADGDRGLLRRLIEARLEKRDVGGYTEPLVRLQEPFWELMCRFYFRLEVEGWERLPPAPCLLVGVHSGGALTIDAWTLIYAWWRRFGPQRVLHGTAHDVLMAAPGLGDYFRAMGVLPASPESVGRALAKGDDVAVWPGGEKDSMRHWTKRDTAVLAGRTGFVRMALEHQVPIVPVATVGGHDTVFVVSEGEYLARLGPNEQMRGARAPIVVGPPFGIAIEVTPMHLPLPAKIRTELLEPLYLDEDPERAGDEDYVQKIYEEVRTSIQAGMDRLASRRRFPVFF